MIASNRSKTSAPAMPDPPDTLSGGARDLWNQLATKLYESGRLSDLDAPAFAGICRAYGRWLEAEQQIDEQGAVVKNHAGFAVANPFLAVSKSAWKQYLDGCSAFGLTPKARGEGARRQAANAIASSNPRSTRTQRAT